MTSPSETAADRVTAEEASDFLVKRHIRHLAILGDNGRLLGMISMRNLLEHMVEDLQRESHGLGG
jgi:CBS domain-containing protein